jgi:phage FluMu gp28-like protein
MYDKQEKAVFNDSRYSLVEASTKSGKTVSCLVWLIEQALLHGKTGHVYWWLAPTYSQSRIVFRRMKQWMPKEIVLRFNESELTATLINNTTIHFKTAEHPDSLFGEDVHALVIDEASRCREESFHACRSVVTATNGKIRMIGNVRGRKNWFYLLCRRAEQGLENYHYAKITAQDAIEGGVLDEEEIAEAKVSLPPTVFEELYNAKPSDSNQNPFGEQAIKKCIGEMSKNAPFVYGVDLAKSVDYTVIIALDQNGAVCFFERFQKSWNETRQRLIEVIGSVDCIIDSTGVGDPLTEDLQRVLPRVEGFKFSSTSKQQLMELLSNKISTQQVTYPDNEIVNELLNFEYEFSRTGVRYSSPPGLHDDAVMALALALRGQNNVPGIGIW